MDARQGADLVELLKPPVTVPVHFDDYDRFKSPLGDFVAEVARRRAARGAAHRAPRRHDQPPGMTEWIRGQEVTCTDPLRRQPARRASSRS